MNSRGTEVQQVEGVINGKSCPPSPQARLRKAANGGVSKMKLDEFEDYKCCLRKPGDIK